MSLELARRVADAVLYEGYLLYPYRATSGKNQVRWQFGVLGPIGAAEPARARTRTCPCSACCGRLPIRIRRPPSTSTSGSFRSSSGWLRL